MRESGRGRYAKSAGEMGERTKGRMMQTVDVEIPWLLFVGPKDRLRIFPFRSEALTRGRSQFGRVGPR